MSRRTKSEIGRGHCPPLPKTLTKVTIPSGDMSRRTKSEIGRGHCPPIHESPLQAHTYRAKQKRQRVVCTTLWSVLGRVPKRLREQILGIAYRLSQLFHNPFRKSFGGGGAGEGLFSKSSSPAKTKKSLIQTEALLRGRCCRPRRGYGRRSRYCRPGRSDRRPGRVQRRPHARRRASYRRRASRRYGA